MPPRPAAGFPVRRSFNEDGTLLSFYSMTETAYPYISDPIYPI